MVALIAPNGAPVEANEEAVQRLLECGFRRAEREDEPKPKAAPRKRAAKPKE